MNARRFCYMLMVLLVCLWALEYIVAKKALEVFPPLTLLFFKFLVASVVLWAGRCIKGRRPPLRLKDVPAMVLCVFFGYVVYYFCEYNAIKHVSVALVTIILAFTPLVSIGVEAFLFRKKPSLVMIVGTCVCIAGVGLVIGADLGGADAQSAKVIGCAFAFVAVLAWNIYNFMTEKFSKGRTALDLAIIQITCTMLMLLPYIALRLPDPATFTVPAVGGAIYLGIANAIIGNLIYVKALSVIGSTPCALFANFLPVAAALFGWAFLGENLTLVQIFGGAAVVVSACAVIVSKGKTETRLAETDGAAL